MKPVTQNFHFSIRIILPALFCFAMIPSAMATERYSSRAIAATSSQQDYQKDGPIRLADSTDNEADAGAKRQKMMEDCKANRGTDCEKQVNTELEAQELDISHTAPPASMERPVRPRPVPRAR